MKVPGTHCCTLSDFSSACIPLSQSTATCN
jgi:hypothetical protein